jgi:pyruvate/2-oxoglutarate dehydrogenase complex dihydrolipoamide dehydrogenase (E3) component
MARALEIPPADEHNRTLVSNVHPADWVNPTPRGRYNLVVVGAGTGGLISALITSSLGGRVALVERHLMGGDCLNVGCVPSKAVIRASRITQEARRAAELLGLPIPADWQPDFAAAMERMRGVRARISHEDSAERYTKEFGIDVYLGEARFTGPGRIEVDGSELRFRKAVIASGARAAAPPIPGLAETGYLTNESVFNLTERPRRLGVIGSGPIGCELAQAFQRLGSQVVLFEQREQILTREDPDAAAIVQDAFVREGIELVLGCSLEKVEAKGEEKVIHVACSGGSQRQIVVDEILVGAGRTPNVEGLGLETVGVEYDPRRGVVVDDHLRTTNQRIFAVGDICMNWKFTHAAEAAAKIAVQNAFFSFGLPFLRKSLSKLVMPWATYTDPEIAHVGRYAHELEEEAIPFDSFRVPMAKVDRAIADGEDAGFIKVLTEKGKDRILGATSVSSQAGEMISELTTATVGGLGLGTFTNVIHPYPTQAEAVKRVAGEYTRTRLTPGAKRIFDTLMRLRR